MNNSHFFSLRVYYEDTDVGGIVYYANYLKFAERARTEALRGLRIDQSDLLQNQGLKFVVRDCFLNCFAPARLDDILDVKTDFKKIGHAKIAIQQVISRGDQVIASLDVTLACLNSEGRPVKLTGDLRRLLIDLET